MQLAGTVESFDELSFETSIAKLLHVALSQVVLAVSPASLRVEVNIRVPDMAAALGVESTLHEQTAASLSHSIGTEVVEVEPPTIEVVVMQVFPPPIAPPLSPHTPPPRQPPPKPPPLPSSPPPPPSSPPPAPKCLMFSECPFGLAPPIPTVEVVITVLCLALCCSAVVAASWMRWTVRKRRRLEQKQAVVAQQQAIVAQQQAAAAHCMQTHALGFMARCQARQLRMQRRRDAFMLTHLTAVHLQMASNRLLASPSALPIPREALQSDEHTPRSIGAAVHVPQLQLPTPNFQPCATLPVPARLPPPSSAARVPLEPPFAGHRSYGTPYSARASGARADAWHTSTSCPGAESQDIQTPKCIRRRPSLESNGTHAHCAQGAGSVKLMEDEPLCSLTEDESLSSQYTMSSRGGGRANMARSALERAANGTLPPPPPPPPPRASASLEAVVPLSSLSRQSRRVEIERRLGAYADAPDGEEVERLGADEQHELADLIAHAVLMRLPPALTAGARRRLHMSADGPIDTPHGYSPLGYPRVRRGGRGEAVRMRPMPQPQLTPHPQNSATSGSGSSTHSSMANSLHSPSSAALPSAAAARPPLADQRDRRAMRSGKKPASGVRI